MQASVNDPDRLLDPEFHASESPRALWSWMRLNAPVHWHPPTKFPGFWSLTQHADIRAAYSNPQLFSSSRGVLLRQAEYGDDPGGGLTLALTDPPRHKQIRSIMSKWFTMSYARSLEDLIRAKVKKLINQIVEQGGCDFTHDVAVPLTLYVTCHVLGVPEADHNDIMRLASDAFESGKPLAAQNEFMLYFGDLMELKSANPSDDLASALIQGIVEDELLAEDEILLNYENLIGATENAGLSLSGGILAFLKYPDSWRMLYDNRELLATAIEEVLRWASSASHSMRTVTGPTILNGQELNQGDRVVLWLPSANRDETVFANPNQFDIARRPNNHLSLGYGEHFCIGNALGRIQMRILFTELLNMNFPLELSGEPIGLRSIHVNGPIVLPVRFKNK